jgi:TolB-like protein
MGMIFLSYARDDVAFAETLTHVLEGAGHDVWWDRHLDGGEEFAAEIEAALAKSDAVLVAWSKTSVKSRWVRDEATSGCERGRLIPVSLDGTPPPMGFRQFHTLDLTGWRGARSDDRTAELLRAVDRRLGAPLAVPSQPKLRRDRHFVFSHRPKVAIGFLVLMTAVAAAALYFLAFRNAPATADSRPTLALLPFKATSADPGVSSLASQARESAAHRLSDSGMPVRLVDRPPDGKAGSADYLMLGEFSGGGGKRVATIRLEDARQRMTVWSRRFEIDAVDAAILPERIGAQVAGTLGWAGALRMLAPGHAPDPNLTGDLLRQVDLTGDALEAYQIAQRLGRKWPKSGMVQLSIALNTAFALSELPREERAAAVASGRKAAERARELMSDFGDTHIPECLLQPEVLIADCERRLRAGLRADPDAPFVSSFLGRLLANVGRNQEGFEQARLSYVHDPYMPAKIAAMIRMQIATGDRRGAAELYAEAVRWWPESGLLWSYLWGLVAAGDYGGIAELQREMGAEAFTAEYAGIANVARAISTRDAVALKRACPASGAPWVQQVECMLGLAQLGDLDAAFALAAEYYPTRLAGTRTQEEKLWLDEPDTMPLEFLTSAAAAPLRRDARYLDLARRTGLLQYWRSGSLPDFCRKSPEPVCSHIGKGR